MTGPSEHDPGAGVGHVFGPALNTVPLPVLAYDIETLQVLAVNDEACRAYGYGREEWLALTIADIRPPEEVPAMLEAVRAAHAPAHRSGIHRHRRKDGSVMDVDVVSSPVTLDGRAARIVVAIDVTERLRAERKLRASDERLTALVGSIDEIMFEFDADGTYLNIWTGNPELLAAPAEQLVGRRLVEMLGEEVGRPFEDAVRRVVSTGLAETLEYELEVGGARRRFLGRLARIPPSEDRPATVSFLARDVTERHQAEEALREAESLYRSLVEALPAITYIELPSAEASATNFVYLSPQVESILGYTPDEIIARPDGYYAIVHPDDRERLIAENAHVEATGERFDSFYRLIARDGHVVWMHSLASLVRDEQGEPRFWHGVALDVTPQYEAEGALREAEQRYRLVVENASDLITLVEPDGKIVFASPSHENLLGLSPQDMVGRNVIDVLGPLNAGSVRSSLEAVAAGERAPVRVTFTRPDGRQLVLETPGGEPILDEQGRVRLILGVTRDVTEEVRAEREREELLSTLVAAQEEERARIASDIHDDPIQAMVAVGIQLDLFAEHTSDPALLARVERLRTSVHHAVDRLRRLLFELSPPSLESGLGAAIVELAERVEKDAGFGLHIDDRTTRELPIDARTAAFRIVQEALANVRKHARARNVIVRLDEREGGTAVVVEDDGIGISAGTTSEAGHLGLRGMQERAILMGGRLEFGPRPGGGTYVEFWLPSSPS